MTRWYSVQSGKPLTPRSGRWVVQQAALGEVRLADVVQLRRVRRSALVRRAPSARRADALSA